MGIQSLLKAGAIMAFCIAGISGVRFIITGFRLSRYLQENHMEAWKSLPFAGSGCYNPLKGMRFLFGQDDCGNKEVWKMKLTVRNSYIYALTGIVAAYVIGFLAAAFGASARQQ